MKEKAFLILLLLISILTVSRPYTLVNASPTIYSEHEIQLQDKFEPWLWDRIQNLTLANGTIRYYSLVIRLDPEKIVTASGEDYKNWTATFLYKKHGAITNYICNVFPVIILKMNVTQIKAVAAYDFVLHLGDGEAKGSLTLDVSVPTIEADDVHSMGFNGSGVTVGITDTGIDDSHPVFQNKRIIFRDFHAGTPEVIKQPWETGDRPDIYDYVGHGTHVASILAGDDPNDVYDGVAFGVDTLIIASLGTGVYDPTDPNSVQAGEDEYIHALDWLVQRGAQVISSSWGWQRRWEPPGWYCDGTCEVCRAADDVVDNGVVMVQAAGNEGLPRSQFPDSPYAVTDDGYSSLRCPATAFNVITVGASNDHDTPDIGDDTIAYFTPSQWPPYGWASSKGPTADGRLKPDVVAPGVNVYSGDPVGPAGYYLGDWGNFSGTSAATPHVAGVAALLLQAHPEWRPHMVKLAIKARATLNDNLMALTQNDRGWGIVDAEGAVLCSMQEHRYWVMGGITTTCGHRIAYSPWWWDVPFHTREPYLTPNLMSYNIAFSDPDPVTGVVYLTVPAETYVGLEHVWYDDLGLFGYPFWVWLRFTITMDADGYGWLFTGEGTDPILGDVDYNTFSNNSGVYWSPDGEPAASISALPSSGPDCIAGTDDDGFGDETLDPVGSSILFLNTVVNCEWWDADNEVWAPLYEVTWPQVMTTGTAYNIVDEPTSVINGANSTQTGQPWEFLAGLDHPGWKVDYDHPQWNAYVTYACVWSVLEIETSLGPLDMLYVVVERLVREDCVIADISGDEKVTITDQVIASLAFGAEDEWLGGDGIPGTPDDKQVADDNYDARPDFKPKRGKITMSDIVRIALDFGASLTPDGIIRP